MKKILLVMVLSMTVQLLGCIDSDDKEKNGSLKLLQISPASGTTLQPGMQIVAELEYSIKNNDKDDDLSFGDFIILYARSFNPNTNKDENFVIHSRQLWTKSGVVTFTYTVDDTFFSNQYFVHPYELFFELSASEFDIFDQIEPAKTKVFVYW